MRLCDAEINQVCYIVSVDNDASVAGRLKELGFIKGQKVLCSDVGIFSSPVAYKLCGTKIALRKSESRFIEVELIDE